MIMTLINLASDVIVAAGLFVLGTIALISLILAFTTDE